MAMWEHTLWDSMGLYGFQRFPVLDFLAHLYTFALRCYAKTFLLRLRRKDKKRQVHSGMVRTKAISGFDTLENPNPNLSH